MLLVERKWVSVLEALYSRAYIERLIKGNLKVDQVMVGSAAMASFVEIEVVGGNVSSDQINDLLLERVSKIAPAEAAEVADYYVLTALFEVGVIHSGVMDGLSKPARRVVLEGEADEGMRKLRDVSRLRGTKQEDR